MEELGSQVVEENQKDYSYAAPEEFKREYSAKSDVYALALTLWEMFASQKPIPPDCRDFAQLREQVLLQKWAPAVPAVDCAWPEALCQLLRDCFQFDPAARPTAEQVVSRLVLMAPDFGAQAFLASLRARVQIQLQPFQKALETYVPSNTESKDGTQQQPAANPTVDDSFAAFLASDQAACMVLMGAGGLGKSLSTFELAGRLLMDARKAAAASRSSHGTFTPVFLRFGQQLRWDHANLPDAIATAFRALQVDDTSQLCECSFLFVLDGYDELSGTPLGNLPAQLGLARWPNSKLLVTCRPDALPTEKLQPTFAPQEGRAAVVVHLLPLQDKHQLMRLLNKKLRWGQEESSGFRTLLDKNAALVEVLKTPFVLSLFADSWEVQQEKLRAGGQPSREQIYRGFIEHWVKQTCLVWPADLLPPDLHPGGRVDSYMHYLKALAVSMANSRSLVVALSESPLAADSSWSAQCVAASVEQHTQQLFGSASGAAARTGARSLLNRSQYQAMVQQQVDTRHMCSPVKYTGGVGAKQEHAAFIHK